MLDRYPVFTLDNDCQDCCKCVRHCPVKAIGVKNGRAKIIPGFCIVCGKCVEVCPAKVKTIRDDLDHVKELLGLTNRSTYVSLDPSWINEFPGIDASVIIKALTDLGFQGVSETGLGAEQVASELAQLLSKNDQHLWISSACPSVVEYIEKHDQELIPYITPFLSPLLAHCKILKQNFGENARIVHFGSCIASKIEAERYPDLLYASLTFKDLKKWIADTRITLNRNDFHEGYSFVPERAGSAWLYSIEGDLTESVRKHGTFPKVDFITLSGIDHVRETLRNINLNNLSEETVFLECTACPGGCINGPCSDTTTSLLSRQMNIKQRNRENHIGTTAKQDVSITETFRPKMMKLKHVTEEQVTEALLKLGKKDNKDELNCGGCGYYTCRAFAEAMVMGMTEPEMCVSFMRQKAKKKSNALMSRMPSGVVIADHEMKIVECNQRFAELFGEEALSIYKIMPGLKGASLPRIIPFSDLFCKVLKNDRDIRLDHYRYEGKLYEIVIFSIEPHEVVGAVILDVTRRELRRDKIAQRADEVIQKNLSTVQEIACRLGEHMAETEILLRSIAEGYSDEDKNDKDGGFPEI